MKPLPNWGDTKTPTRIASTVHNSGSQFTQGSALQLSNMRSTKQYAMPMIAFHCQSGLDFDLAADGLGSIGKAAKLTLDRAEYAVQVAWITEEMASYIFDCPALPEGTVSFAVEGRKLHDSTALLCVTEQSDPNQIPKGMNVIMEYMLCPHCRNFVPLKPEKSRCPDCKTEIGAKMYRVSQP